MMMNKNLTIYLLLFVLLLCGCGSTKNNYMAKRMKAKKEIIQIAVGHLEKENKLQDFYLDKYLIKKQDNVWYVAFLKKPQIQSFISVDVSVLITIDDSTGQVLKEVIQKGFYLP